MLTFIRNIFIYVLALLVVFDSNVIYQYDYALSGVYNKVWSVMVIIAMLGCVFSNKSISKHSIVKFVIVDFFILTWIAIHYMLRPYQITADALFYEKISILLAYYFFVDCANKTNNAFDDLLIAFKNIVTVIGAASVLFWGLATVLTFIPPTGQIYSTWSSDASPVPVRSWYNIYFETQNMDAFDMGNITRNTSIFTEGPMASMCFCFALLINQFIDTKSPLICTVILIISILSTISATGYVFLLMIFIQKYISLLDYRKDKLKVILLPIIFIVCGCIAFLVFDDKLDSSSLILRTDDYIVGFDAWSAEWLLGWGIGNHQAIVNYMDMWRVVNSFFGFSNGIFAVLVEGGLFIGGVYILSFIKGALQSKINKDIVELTETICVLYLFILSVISVQTILLIFIFRLLVYKKRNA